MNIELTSGQIALLHISIESPSEGFELYGGTQKGAFQIDYTGSPDYEWLCTIREADVVGTPLGMFNIYARELATGREWVILSGKIIVTPRTASVPADKLHPVEYFITVPVRNSHVDAAGNVIVQGIPGPKGERGEKGEPGEGGVSEEERALLMGAAQRDADNTFTAVNTFTGAVDMSGASVTPPSGWNVGELTAEAVQAVVPIYWTSTAALRIGIDTGDTWIATLNIGTGSRVLDNHCVSLGTHASSSSGYALAVGYRPSAKGTYSLAFGYDAKAKYSASISIGSAFTETTDSGKVTHTCTTEGTGSITIGAGANTLNTTTADGSVTESSNSVTIGSKASNKGADSVVIGAQAKATAGGTVAIGAGAEAADAGAVVFASYSTDRSYKTQLYFSGAGSALANTYAGGEGIMGYVTADSAGNVIASGYKKLSALFDEGSMTQPATLDEFGDWVMPKVFQPGTLPQQEYQPLPVYPIVEPEPLTE